MIKLTKEQKELIKELEKIEAREAAKEESRMSQKSDDVDNYSHQTEHPHDPHSLHHSEQYDSDDMESDYHIDDVQGDSESSTYGTSADETNNDYDHIDDSKILEEAARKEAERKAEEKQKQEEQVEQEKFEKENRGIIAFEKEDGSIISSVVEKWGGRGNLGRTLIEHYDDQKSALKVCEIGCISKLKPTIKKTIQNKNKINRTKELQIFDNFDEYDKYIKVTRDFDCAFLWRNESWEFLDWFFEYEQNDFGVDITKDEYLSRLILSSTSLKKEKNKSKFIKRFPLKNGNWERIGNVISLLGEITDEIPF